MAASTASRISQNLSSCRNTDALLAQLRDQFDQGETTATLSFTSIKSLGQDGLRHLIQRVEADLLSKFTVEANMVANTARFTPVVPEEEPSSHASTPSTTNTKPIITSKKVPRPANAFIIYRRDWHAKMVAKYPGLHNNKISRIIGDQWRDESQDVKDLYAQKAKDLKHQHLINNPGYHYQPRKPHEKKRRMTKRKIAALAAQKQASTATATSSEEQSAQSLSPNALDVAQMAGPQLQFAPSGAVTFTAAPDPNNTLGAVCTVYNLAHSHIIGPVTATPYISDAGVTAQTLADEGPVMNEFDFTTLARNIARGTATGVATNAHQLLDTGISNLQLDPTFAASTAPSHGSNGGDDLSDAYYAQDMLEYDRQTDLAHADALGTLFDFDAFGEPVGADHQNASVDGAESATTQAEATYDLSNIDGDFEMTDDVLTQILGVPCVDGMIVEQTFDDPVYLSMLHDASMLNTAADSAAGGL